MNPLPFLGKFLLIIGLVIVGIGLLLLLSPEVPWLGRLPGDIVIIKERFRFLFPYHHMHHSQHNPDPGVLSIEKRAAPNLNSIFSVLFRSFVLFQSFVPFQPFVLFRSFALFRLAFLCY